MVGLYRINPCEHTTDRTSKLASAGHPSYPNMSMSIVLLQDDGRNASRLLRINCEPPATLFGTRIPPKCLDRLKNLSRILKTRVLIRHCVRPSCLSHFLHIRKGPSEMWQTAILVRRHLVVKKIKVNSGYRNLQ